MNIITPSGHRYLADEIKPHTTLSIVYCLWGTDILRLRRFNLPRSGVSYTYDFVVDRDLICKIGIEQGKLVGMNLFKSSAEADLVRGSCPQSGTPILSRTPSEPFRTMIAAGLDQIEAGILAAQDKREVADCMVSWANKIRSEMNQ